MNTSDLHMEQSMNSRFSTASVVLLSLGHQQFDSLKDGRIVLSGLKTPGSSCRIAPDFSLSHFLLKKWINQRAIEAYTLNRKV